MVLSKIQDQLDALSQKGYRWPTVSYDRKYEVSTDPQQLMRSIQDDIQIALFNERSDLRPVLEAIVLLQAFDQSTPEKFDFCHDLISSTCGEVMRLVSRNHYPEDFYVYDHLEDYMD